MNIKRCWIVGAGDFFEQSFTPASGDKTIAVDAGYKQLERLGVCPDMVVGDFDSLGSVPEHPNVVRHPAVKDDTDMLLAVNEAVAMGCNELLLFGGTGGRLAHTLANLQVLAFLAGKRLSGYLVDKSTVITALHNGELTFDESHSGFVSVLAHGGTVGGVTLTGLKYPLTNAVLTTDRPLGVSNEFTGTQAKISIGSGTAIVLWQNNTKSFPEREDY